MSDIRDFNSEGTFYTAYPSLSHWKDMDDEEYSPLLSEFLAFEKPFHLYVHIPFCAKLCFYCVCNFLITNDNSVKQKFVDYLCREIDILKACGKTDIREIQLGGGTPSHLSREQFSQLCAKLDELVDLRSLDEFAMEIDPRIVKPGDLEHYASWGVTRISFGIQDFNAGVQEAINRVQPFEMVEKILEDRHFFKGVNFDILYGLPRQTHETVAATLWQVKQLSPDRITLLKYCHAPEVRRHMKLIKDSELPKKQELPVMFLNAIHSLMDEGYQWIGLDHFAKSTDSLAEAARNGEVGRTFNGFTPGRVKDMIGLGPTSTGAFGRTYSQALYGLKEYYESIDAGRHPILRGYRLTEDDLARRDIIFSLLCNQRASIDSRVFGRELGQIPEDLATYEKGQLVLTTHGRVLLRNICAVFDSKKERVYKIAQHSMTVKNEKNTAHQPA